ncbi:DUF397 domain-containing protein [Nocardia concava]|uniref:DUF397 domain-containing protein n=1 Tax=Nocardia concava TaxID=257281 RepID=UPI00031BD870|nr:DUF397 domain-containing protein [Nocardia concava]
MNSQPRAWFKSTRSKASETCVEVCFDSGRVGVRDSKNVGGPELFFEGSQWDTFLRSRIWQH